MGDNFFSNPVWLVALVLGAINLIAFAFVGIDKSKSAHDHQRVPELYFFIWATFLSSLGVLLGMLVFRHKTRKWTFIFGITLLVIQQILLLYFLTVNFIL